MKKAKQRLSIVGIVGVPAKYGGFETLVENLLDSLAKTFSVTVFCQKSAYDYRQSSYKNAKLKYICLRANGFQSIFFDSLGIFRSFYKSEVLLILGVSGAVALRLIRPFYHGKIVVNIDGLEWRRNKWSKFTRVILKYFEGLAVRSADVIIADNYHIKSYVYEEYNKEAVLVEYGGDHVSYTTTKSALESYGLQSGNYFFKVCRIEPENNVDMILSSYIRCGSPKKFMIVGNFSSSDYGRSLRKKFSKDPSVFLCDPIYDQIVLNELRSNCYYYLHGHSAGGTNPSLVEAMFLGLPIIAYGVSYNRATTGGRAIYFENTDELVDIFLNIEVYDRDGIAMFLKEFADVNYRWKRISAKYMECCSARNG